MRITNHVGAFVALSFRKARSAGFLTVLLGALGACQAPTEAPGAGIGPGGPITEPLSVMPSGFQESTVWKGFTQPTAVRFAPDGRVFVAEKRGRIWVFDGLTDPTPTLFAELDKNVHNFWDRGLLGLAVHPNFPATPYVYALYSLDAPIGGTPPVFNDGCDDATGNGCVIGARLSRLEAAGNVSTGAETVLIEAWGQQYPSHSIGDLAFGADGALYVTGGDGASFTFTDYGQSGSPKNPLGDPPVGVGGTQAPPLAAGGSLRSQSPRRVGGGPVLLNGALLRLDPLTGKGMPDNPWAASSDENARRTIAYGFRNPFRFTFRPGSKEAWVGDVGANTWEEINRVPDVSDATVDNFGWPCYEGAEKQSGFDGANLDLCEQLYGTANAVSPPQFTYRHGSKIVPDEACDPGSSSITALAFYGGTKYPEKYRGALFFGDYSRKCAWVMLPGADGTPDASKVELFASGLPRPVDFQVGPGGDIFYADIEGGEIRRLQYLVPVAQATATPTAGTPPLVVSLDASGSQKALPEDTLTYAWDLNGDGLFDDAVGATPSTVFATVGTYSARVKVTDQRGVSDTSAPVAITVTATPVSSTPPVPVIDAPAAGTTWQVGDPISFSGHATDAEDGILPAAALTWLLVMHHCPASCHTHVIRTFEGLASGTFNAPDHEYPSYMELVLVATDSSGSRTTVSVRLDPKTVWATLKSQPSGLKLASAGDSVATPYGRELIKGGLVSLGAPSVQNLGDTPYAFVSWSDGQPASHDVGPLLDDFTVTATYRPAGLTGQYFSDRTLGTLKLTRTDATVGFDWGRLAPDPAVGADGFSVRWTGWVDPLYSETYTFATDADDGIRLWINDVPVIDDWRDQASHRATGTVALTAGQKAKVRLEYYENGGDAVAKLWWSSASQPLQIIPGTRLYPGCGPGVACSSGLTCGADGICVSPCGASTCASTERCEVSAAGTPSCVPACQGLACTGGLCADGACASKCRGVTCADGFACQPATGLCDDKCKTITCGSNQLCAQGSCKPACQVQGCADTERCDAGTGLCVAKCAAVVCDPGFACVPATGACEDKCKTTTCVAGRTCVAGECKPACEVSGCPNTATCNLVSGACDSKCKDVPCGAGYACVETTGQCADRCVLDGLTCPAGFSCQAGECRARCVTEPCASTETCDLTTGLCVSKCAAVTCAAGARCVPTSGACEPICNTLVCRTGQTCRAGACEPACAVEGCPATARCNATTGACDPKCQGVTCNPGYGCNPTTGACEDNCTLAPPVCAAGFACAAGVCQAACKLSGCNPGLVCNEGTGLCVAAPVEDAGVPPVAPGPDAESPPEDDGGGLASPPDAGVPTPRDAGAPASTDGGAEPTPDTAPTTGTDAALPSDGAAPPDARLETDARPIARADGAAVGDAGAPSSSSDGCSCALGRPHAATSRDGAGGFALAGVGLLVAWRRRRAAAARRTT